MPMRLNRIVPVLYRFESLALSCAGGKVGAGSSLSPSDVDTKSAFRTDGVVIGVSRRHGGIILGEKASTDAIIAEMRAIEA